MDAIKEWIEENPLRKYRKEQGLAIMTMASLLGVGMSTIQTWESGAHMPRPESFAAIARVTGMENVRELWDEWLSKKPTLKR